MEKGQRREGRRGEFDKGRGEVVQSMERERERKGLAVEDFHFPAAKLCYSKP